MQKIGDSKCPGRVPRPCEHFDLIGGTGTGGIIAIMLGRLGMTVDQCIRAYKRVAQQAFTPKWSSFLPVRASGVFSAKALEAAIKKMVREYCVEAECVARRGQGHSTIETCQHSDMAFQDKKCTKTVVVATTKDNVDAPPMLFKTYDMPTAFDFCTTWQVARATSASATFFKPIRIGRDEIEFVDAGFGYNNPSEILIEEGQKQFPQRRRMQLLSIGTGLGDDVAIGNTRISIIKALKRMATSSKKVAARLEKQYPDDGQYYRFNVDQGLQDVKLSDWKKASKISAHTANYLDENERMINECAEGLAGRARDGEEHNGETSESIGCEELGQGRSGDLEMSLVVSREEGQMAAILEEASMSHGGVEGAKLCDIPAAGSIIGHPCQTCHLIPFLQNRRFVGRDTTLSMLKEKLFLQKQCQTTAIFGLGGIGKTQVALQLAYWVKEHIPGHSIFWLPALSDKSFEKACREILRKFGIRQSPDAQDAKELVQQHLSSERAGPWFLIIDGADNLDVLFGSADIPGGINDFLPRSEKGVTLFTTRSREVAVAAASSDVVELHEMDLQEADSFFRKSLIQEDLLCDEVVTTQLLEELNLLPLAITQAAAYLNRTGISTAKYLELLRGSEQDMTSLMSRQFYDNTRYKGSQNAVAATWLDSFDQIRKLDNNAANLLAFISCIEPKAIPQSILPRLESEESMAHAMGTLYGYAFVTRREDDEMFDMHSLVHMATRIWVRKQGLMAETMENATRHIEGIFPPCDGANRIIWKDYLPHAMRVLRGGDELDTAERYELYSKVGQCLQVDGRIRKAIKCFKKCPKRLSSRQQLTGAYLEYITD
ncbi:hypothetical protein FQN49_000855 [Arthroderma sp. PD_2]|nr:hypothetical protein FQN49_000855 [Arthroderma sp. PD_2]